jgi:hypothetical protein
VSWMAILRLPKFSISAQWRFSFSLCVTRTLSMNLWLPFCCTIDCAALDSFGRTKLPWIVSKTAARPVSISSGSSVAQ